MSRFLNICALGRSGSTKEPEFLTPRLLADLQKLLDASGTPSTSLHIELDGEPHEVTLTSSQHKGCETLRSLGHS